ncbi:MAG: PEP-CTERM sorting domain-containing protein [Planctomycetota bacterium]
MNLIRPVRSSTPLALGLVLLVGSPAEAAVTFVGTEFDNNAVRGWRTDTVNKGNGLSGDPLDPDGDGIYGTDGYALFMAQPAGNNGSFAQVFPPANDRLNDGSFINGGTTLENIVSYPTGITVTDGFLPFNQGISGFYGTIDNPEGGPDVAMGILRRNPFNSNNLGTDGEAITLTIDSALQGVGDPDSVLRLGVILNNDPNAGKTQAIRVIHATGKGDTFLVTNFAGDFSTSIMFFDIADYAAGDEIQIWFDPQDNSNIFGLSGLTFDSYVIPEPASLSVLAIGGVCLLGRRRSKH